MVNISRMWNCFKFLAYMARYIWRQKQLLADVEWQFRQWGVMPTSRSGGRNWES